VAEIVSNMVQVHIATKSKDSDEYSFLLLKRSDNVKVYPSIWQVITGTVESGETAIQTVIREVKEETGLNPMKMWIVPYISMFFDYKNNEVNAVPVFGILTNCEDIVRLSEEHQSFKWVSFDECLKILPIPQQAEALKVFKEKILEKQNDSLFQIQVSANGI
jgi:dATP pyrophosphohydrolase